MLTLLYETRNDSFVPSFRMCKQTTLILSILTRVLTVLIFILMKKVQLKEDKTNPDIISCGFGEYRNIQDHPIRGRATYLRVRKRKWLDKSSE